MTSELRTYVTTRPTWEYRLWMGSLAATFAIIATAILPPTLWPWLIFAATVAAAMGLGAWCWQLRRTLADRDDELAHADQIITTLAAEAAAAPVPFVPVARALRVVREASDFDWPTNADDALRSRLYNEKGEHRG